MSDNGLRVQDKYHDEIFEEFRRLDAKRYVGSGIGLAKCKEIVMKHNGELYVTNNSRGGADFRFSIQKK